MKSTRELRKDLKETKEFRDTNDIWNDSKLNAVWKVGAVMNLVKDSGATTFEEWEDFYFNSGKERAKILKNGYLPRDEYFRLNATYGRTRKELLDIAKELVTACKKAFGADKSVPTLEDAYNYVLIRVLDETWVGHQREQEACFSVNDYFKAAEPIFKSAPEFRFEATPVNSATDAKYAVDMEVDLAGYIKFGIQLKPLTYKDGDADYLKKARVLNSAKNALYTQEHDGAEVIYLYYNKDRQLINFYEIQNAMRKVLGDPLLQPGDPDYIKTVTLHKEGDRRKYFTNKSRSKCCDTER